MRPDARHEHVAEGLLARPDPRPIRVRTERLPAVPRSARCAPIAGHHRDARARHVFTKREDCCTRAALRVLVNAPFTARRYQAQRTGRGSDAHRNTSDHAAYQQIVVEGPVEIVSEAPRLPFAAPA